MSRTAKLSAGGITLALLFGSSLLFAGDPYTQKYSQRLQAPSQSYFFGTDDFGRDFRARVFQGMKFSLLVSITACSAALLLGGFLGFCILFAPPALKKLLSMLPSAIMAFPPVLLALSLVVLLEPGTTSLVLTLALVFSPVFTRLVETEGRVLLQSEYIAASKSFGSSRFLLVRRHLLPALAIPITAQWTSLMIIAIQTEAALSFIGLGIQPPHASWGTLLLNAQRYLVEAPWLVVTPAISLCLVTTLLFSCARLLSKEH